MHTTSQDKIRLYCDDAQKFILAAGLPSNSGSQWPLIRPTSRLTNDVMEYFWDKMYLDEPISLLVGREISNRLKAEEITEPFPACSYCGTSHSKDGKCSSCGAPSSHSQGRFIHHILLMPRYNFDPVLGYVEAPPANRESYSMAQYEVVCFGSDKPSERRSLMVCRVKQFVFVSCY